MKKALLLFTCLSFLSLSAQQTCCTPTKQFADLGNGESFKSEHQLPKSTNVKETGKWVEFETPDGKTGRAYTTSTGKPTNKYLFVFHEWWGLNDNIINEAEEWAKQLPNVTVIALDLYDGKVATTRDAASQFMQSADEVRVRSIIQGAMDWAGSGAEIATLGWCFGGGWSMQAALMAGEQAVGCVVYYGMPERDVTALEGLNCKVLGIFAEQDQWINRKVVAAYEKAMDEAGKAYATYWYDAAHAFANPSNEIFDEAAAQDAEEKTHEFLQTVF